MSPPETRYARSGDVSIAYQVSGRGPFDLIFVPGFVSNLDVLWETPGFSDLFDRLGRFSRLIRFDKRGTGLSDRVAGIPNLDERMDDVRAVMDAAGSSRAALFGISEGGIMSLLFAATYPERARALVLYGSYARHPTLTDKEILQRYLRQIESLWGTGQFLVRNMLPTKAADEALIRRAAMIERQSASPAAAVAIVRMPAVSCLPCGRQPLCCTESATPAWLTRPGSLLPGTFPARD
jgi:pimeloyl-ACP methyl ester carboxylesterase